MTALIPGSFDPVTTGHLDLITRTAAVFDKVIVTVFDNTTKSGYFTPEQRLKLLKASTAHLPNVTCDLSNGLLAQYAAEHHAVLVKGVRNNTDFDYEENLAAINRSLTGVETMLLPARGEVRHISSTFVRELLKYDRSLDGNVPPEAISLIRQFKEGVK